MVPVKAGRLVQWKLQAVLEALAGINDGLKHVIAMACRRNVCAVIVNIQ
jgi:hypothetical protein